MRYNFEPLCVLLNSFILLALQVLESVVQQDPGEFGPPENLSKNGLVGERQFTAMSALEELRKISRILYEM